MLRRGPAMDDLKQKALGQVAEAGDESALEDIRLAAVGKKGEVALKMRELGKMTPEERQVAGPALNALNEAVIFFAFCHGHELTRLLFFNAIFW